MKKLVLVVFVLVLLVGVVSAACPDGLMGYWKFDENPQMHLGSSADSSLSGNTGTVYTNDGGANKAVVGKVDSAFDFDVNDYISVPDSDDFYINQEFSIGFWVSFDNVAATDGIMGQSIGGGAVPKWAIYSNHPDVAGGGLYFNYYGPARSDIIFQWNPSVNDQWYYVIITREGASWKLWVDGVKVKTLTNNVDIPNIADGLNIGSDGENWGRHNGKMDEVFIFNRALSQEEILDYYNSGSGSDICYDEPLPVFENFCLSSDETIMKLEFPNNSHGELWDGVDYDWGICYDEIFGSVHPGDLGSVHDCDGSNKIVGLYDVGNSHAEIPSLDNYDVDVCYGDLRCVARDLVCEEGEEVVLSLYDTTNSHLASGDFAGYDKKICCRLPLPSVLEWRDMGGNVVSEVQVGDSVRMVMTNSLTGSFEVWENDILFDDAILMGDDAIVGVVDGVNLRGVWVVTEEDLAKTTDYEGFYFNVEGGDSGYLSVDTNGDDDPMNVSIASPICGDDFDEGDSIVIDVSAVDNDDLIIGNVTIDGLVVPFSNGGVVFDYDFNIPGNHQVVVEATNGRGEKSRNIASVMVLDKSGGSYVDGNYVAACIDKPEDFSDILGSVVEFDASNTKGIKVIGGVLNYILPGSTEMNFYWSFFPDGRMYGANYTGTGNSLAYDFVTEFAVAGDNSAVLKVEID